MPQFEKQILVQGKKIYNNNKVTLTRNGNQARAQVNDGKTYMVSINISKNNKISSMKCSCLQKNCVHQAAAAYAFNATRNKSESSSKDSKSQASASNNLSLDQYFLEIKKSAKRERDIYQLFIQELNNRLTMAEGRNDEVKRIIELINDFSKIPNFPKNYRHKVINRLKQAIEKLLYAQNVQEIFSWLVDNRICNQLKEFDEYFNQCKSKVDDNDIYTILSKALKNNDLNKNAYINELLSLYFEVVKNLHKDMSVALIDMVQYKDQSVYQYYEIKNLIDQDHIDEASQAYNRVGNKKDSLMVKLKTELDTYKVDLADEMDKTLREINRCRGLKDIKDLVAQFKKTCDKEWIQWKEPFLSQLSQVTSESHYMMILAQEREWYIAARKVFYMEDLDTFDKYSDILWKNNKEAYYLLYMHCMETEIQNSKGRYYFVVEELKNLILYRGVDKDIVIQMSYDLMHRFPSRKALTRELNNFLDGGWLDE